MQRYNALHAKFREAEALSKAADGASDRVSELEQQLSSAREELKCSNDANATLNAELETAKEATSVCRKEAEQAKQALRTIKETVIRHVRATLSSAVWVWRRGCGCGRSRRVLTLVVRRCLQEATIAGLRRQLENAQQSLSAQQSQHAEAQRVAADAQAGTAARVKELEAQLASEKSRVAQLELDVQEARGDASKEAGVHATRIADLEAKVASLQDALRDAEAAQAAAQAERQATATEQQGALHAAQALQQQSSQQAQALEKQLEEAQAAAKRAQREVEEERARRADDRRGWDVAQKRWAEREAALQAAARAAADKSRDAAAAQHSAGATEVANLQRELRELKRKAETDAARTCVELKGLRDKLGLVQEKLGEETATRVQEVERWKRKLRDAQSRASEAEEKLARNSGDSAARLRQLETEASKHVETISFLKQQVGLLGSVCLLFCSGRRCPTSNGLVYACCTA